METCRTCAKCDFYDDKNWLDLFHPTTFWETEINYIRQEEFNNWKLEIAQNDGLPQKICTDCLSKFIKIYQFRLECQEAQIKLNNIFDKIETQSVESMIEYEIERGDNQSIIDNHNRNNASNNNHCENAKEIDLMNLLQDCDDELIERNSIGNFEHTKDIDDDIPLDITLDNNNLLLIQTKVSTASPTITTYCPKQQTNNEEIFNENDQYNDHQQQQHRPQIAIVGENLVELVGSAIEEDFEPIIINIPPISTAIDENNSSVNYAFECKYCYKTRDTPNNHFLTQQEFLQHIAKVHASESHPFNCPYCEEEFCDAASRTVHIKDKHVEKNFKCKVCNKKYADRFNLRNHFEKYHSDTDFECAICEKRFYSRKSLNYHMKWHNPDRQLKCSYCDRLFINQRHLKLHEVTHTGLRNCEYCQFCGKSFMHLKTLRWHIYRQHDGEKPYKCKLCTEVFASYLEKRIHMLEKHLENLTSIERTECMLCHKHYESELELRDHMDEEHQPTQLSQRKAKVIISANNKRVIQTKKQKNFSGIFQCEVCGQRFNMKSALERHAAVHSTEGRPFSCTLCSKNYKRVQDLNWHLKTHSNEKNICDICGKEFALKYVLNQHKRSHEVLEKNFICTICGRSYLFAKSLRVHERIHTGKTYYKCDLCNESFVTHIKLKYHMRNTHASSNVYTKRESLLDDLISK